MQLQMALVALCDGAGRAVLRRRELEAVKSGLRRGWVDRTICTAASYGRKCPFAGENRLAGRRILNLESLDRSRPGPGVVVG